MKIKHFKIWVFGFSIIIISIMAGNIKIQDNEISMNFFELIASAGSECGVGSMEQLKQPKTGNICSCNGQVVIPQSCESTGKGCSSITCD